MAKGLGFPEALNSECEQSTRAYGKGNTSSPDLGQPGGDQRPEMASRLYSFTEFKTLPKDSYLERLFL